MHRCHVSFLLIVLLFSLRAAELRQWVSDEARSMGGSDSTVADLKFALSHAQQQLHALTRTLAVQREAEGGSERGREAEKPVPQI